MTWSGLPARRRPPACRPRCLILRRGRAWLLLRGLRHWSLGDFGAFGGSPATCSNAFSTQALARSTERKCSVSASDALGISMGLPLPTAGRGQVFLQEMPGARHGIGGRPTGAASTTTASDAHFLEREGKLNLSGGAGGRPALSGGTRPWS
jgi:hypothetical protein